VVSNRHGFRSSRELDEIDDRPHLIVLGDSFVFGEGVEEEERFTNLLQTRTGWRVANMGMTGWGPDLMLRAFEAVGVGLRPDAVLLCIYTHAFRRVGPFYAGVGFRIPRYEAHGEDLVTIPYPQPAPWHRLRLFWAVTSIRRDAYWDVHEAILDRFRELADEHDFGLGIVFLPGRADVSVDRDRRAWLADYSGRFGVPFLDLTEPVHRPPRSEVFIRGNPHWNPAGHRLVADELQSFVDENLSSVPAYR